MRNIENSRLLTHREYSDPGRENDGRRAFQLDRDRIVHSRAFRRLMHKTQIFNANKGDHYRNRLTHTLEVSQIARSISRLLQANEDLVEAISLGHDLGHTPFGHVGERTIEGMLTYKRHKRKKSADDFSIGFKHNLQSVHLLTNIEERCDDYKGLNVTLATKEGILKHTKFSHHDYSDAFPSSELFFDYESSITIEGQIVAIADEIAQVTHDIEDGIRSNIIDFNDFSDLPLVSEYCKGKNINLCSAGNRLEMSSNNKNRVIKGLVGYLIDDVSFKTKEKLSKYHDAYGEPSFENKSQIYKECCVVFSKEVASGVKQISKLRDDSIISSQVISQSDSKSEFFIKQIFNAYVCHPLQLPDSVLKRIAGTDNRREVKEILPTINKRKLYRCIADHIAGMTDQFACREYVRLYLPDAQLIGG